MPEKNQSYQSESYWEQRYSMGMNSGSGSYGRLADFKAVVINDFIREHKLETIVEFGSGDGNQLSLLRVPKYKGYDVSNCILNWLKRKFASDASKEFFHITEYDGQKSDLALSLDVIFHLVDDIDFERYMRTLFGAAEKYVIIYSSNQSAQEENPAAHFRHRLFTPWIEENEPGWRLLKKIDNPFPYNGTDPQNTSTADFYIYERAAGSQSS